MFNLFRKKKDPEIEKVFMLLRQVPFSEWQIFYPESFPAKYYFTVLNGVNLAITQSHSLSGIKHGLQINSVIVKGYNHESKYIFKHLERLNKLDKQNKNSTLTAAAIKAILNKKESSVNKE